MNTWQLLTKRVAWALAFALAWGGTALLGAPEGPPQKPEEEPRRVVVAVLPFDGPDKEVCRAATETVTTDLARSKRLQLVERARIQNVLEELKIQSSGVTDEATALKIGQLLNAQKVVLGSVTRVGRTLALHIRSVDVKGGAIEPGKADQKEGSPDDAYQLAHVLATSFHYLLTGEVLPPPPSIPTAKPTFAAPDVLSQIGPSSAGITLQAKLDRPEGSLYYWNEPIAVFFQVDRPCYVYLFNVDTARKVTLLFPNQFRPDPRVQPNRWHRVPGEGEEWEFAIAGELGEEEVVVIATTEPLADVAAGGEEGFNAFMGKSVVPRLRQTEGSSSTGRDGGTRPAPGPAYAIQRLRFFSARKP